MATTPRPVTVKPAEAALLLQFAPLVSAALVSLTPARELDHAEKAPESHGWMRRPGRWSMAGPRGIRGGESDGRQDVAVRWDVLAALVARIRAERPDTLPELADAREEWSTARGPVVYLPKGTPEHDTARAHLAAADRAMVDALRACLLAVVRAPRGFEPVPVPARPFRFVDAVRFGLEDTPAGRAALAESMAAAPVEPAAAQLPAVVALAEEAGPLELPGMPAPVHRPAPAAPLALFDLEEPPARIGRSLAGYVARARGRVAELAAPEPLPLFA